MRNFFSLLACVFFLVSLSGCGKGDKPDTAEPSGGGDATPPVEVEAFVKEVTPAEAETLVGENPDLVIVDVRTPAEFADGHITTAAINVDVMSPDFAEQMAKLDKSKPYLLHCGSGRRSRRALEQFSEAGFNQLYHLTDGLSGWKSAGKPVSSE